MEIIKIFLPVEAATIGTVGFMTELKQLLPAVSFQDEYELSENPFTVEAKVSDDTAMLLISLKRKDLLSLTAMSVFKKIPTIFFFDTQMHLLSQTEQYFISRLTGLKNITFAQSVSCEKNQGVQKFSAQISCMI
ncbi:MAG: hypothetical protein WAW11_01960 [Patescibacteria group bacterium]